MWSSAQHILRGGADAPSYEAHVLVSACPAAKIVTNHSADLRNAAQIKPNKGHRVMSYTHPEQSARAEVSPKEVGNR